MKDLQFPMDLAVRDSLFITQSGQLPNDDAEEEVLVLREWGTDRIYHLQPIAMPRSNADTGNVNALGLSAQTASFDITCEHRTWRLRDLAGRVDLRHDGVPCTEVLLVPGLEISVGGTTLIAESRRSMALRDYCARLLGWKSDRLGVVDHALRSIRLAMFGRSPLFLRGDGDLVPIARAIHRRTLGSLAPFVVSDKRRMTTDASVRSPANHEGGLAAFRAAAGGSLCIRSSRLPVDYSDVKRLFHEPGNRTCLHICSSRNSRNTLLSGPAPIEIPPLEGRGDELPRIVMEYAAEAVGLLEAGDGCFTRADLQWVMDCAATSLPEIEKATLRLVALRKSTSVRHAAEILGIRQVSLIRWLRRRKSLVNPNRILPDPRPYVRRLPSSTDAT